MSDFIKKKNCYRTIFLLFVLFILGSFQANLNAQGVWEDGFPQFSRISQIHWIRVDTLIQLAPIDDSFQEADNFRFILGGYDWKWPLNSVDLGQPTAEDIDFRTSRGNELYVVVDRHGNRVIEINPAEGTEVWQYHTSETSSDKYLDSPVSVQSFEENGAVKYLITDKFSHRVTIVDREFEEIEWGYGNKSPGKDPNQLRTPADAVVIPGSNHVIICDEGNDRILVIDRSDSSIIWEYGDGIRGELNVPVDVDYVPETNEILVTEQNNHRVSLINLTTDSVTFQLGGPLPGLPPLGLNNPTDADYLPNGNIMICDSSNQRLFEITRDKQIVWQFHRALKGLKDADRLPDNRILIIADSANIISWPFRIGYKDQTFTSSIHELEKNVIFDSLYLTAAYRTDTTVVRVWMRSARQDEDINIMKWYGPTGENDFYVGPVTAINPIHNGAVRYQLKADLLTTDPLYTPELTQARVTYHYFNEDSVGTALTAVISDSPNVIITSWDSLSYNTILPANHLRRNDVQLELQIYDAQTNLQLIDPIQVNPLTSTHGIRLSGNPSWSGDGVQAIRLRANLRTLNSSLSPILENWRIEWSTTQASASQIEFVDGDFLPVTYYKISTDTSTLKFNDDFVHVLLVDPNLAETSQNMRVTINVRSGTPGELDSAVVDLTRQSNGEFVNLSGMKAIISNSFPDPADKTLQLSDRDTLIVTYQDPLDFSDVNVARAVVIQNTRARIQIENRFRLPIETAAIGDTIHVRVFNENDQNYSSAQDTIFVELIDPETRDSKILTLVELLNDSAGTYDTGEFVTPQGIYLTSGSTSGLFVLQTLAGNRVDAKYSDNYTAKPTAIASILIGGEPIPTAFSGLYDFVIAPNPFRADQHTLLRLRAFTNIGDLRLDKVEIFNIAGEKVREIEGTDIFDAPIPELQFRETLNVWWDFENDSGDPIASGTYWIKFSANLDNTENGGSQSISVLKKFLLLR